MGKSVSGSRFNLTFDSFINFLVLDKIKGARFRFHATLPTPKELTIGKLQLLSCFEANFFHFFANITKILMELQIFQPYFS